MGNEYTRQRAWADKFIPRQRKIIADLFGVTTDQVRISKPPEDWAGIDAFIGETRIGLRVRRSGPARKDIAFRLKKGKDGMNEWGKVKAGSINYMLHCRATPQASADDSTDDEMDRWFLLDMRPFVRAAESRFDGVRCETRHVDDCHLIAVDIESLAKNYGAVVMASETTTTTTTTTPDGSTTTTTTTTTNRHPQFTA